MYLLEIASLTSSVTDCVKFAYDIVSYRTQEPELDLIKIVSWQTGDIGKLCIVSKDFIEYL